jgi:hypothetical protein
MNPTQNWWSKPVVNSVAPEEEAVLAPRVVSVVLLFWLTSSAYNDNELNLCHECQKNEISMLPLNSIYMYFFTKIANYKKVEIVKYFEGYI